MRTRRHPADVTADRLIDASQRWYDKFEAAERDMISQIVYALGCIATGDR